MKITKRHIVAIAFAFLKIFEIFGQVNKEPVFYGDSSQYDVSFYSINLDVSSNSTYLSGYTIIQGKAVSQPLVKLYAELSDTLTIDSIIINQKQTPFQHQKGWIKAQLKSAISVGTTFSALVYYHGIAKTVSSMGGIGTSNTYGTDVLYTLSEPFYSSDFFPCKQWLTDKCDSVYMNITVPENQTVAATGILKSRLPMSGNKTQFQWQSHYPTAYYLIAFSVANYTPYHYKFYDKNYGDSVLFQNYLYPDTDFIHSGKADIDKTPGLIMLYEKLTGVPFPFRKEKYGHATAPIDGGMENQTLTILDEINYNLIAHELGHSWFGDMVTCSDWQNIWINEGFASYFEYLAYENIYPDDAKSWLTEAMRYATQDPTGSVYVPNNSRWDEHRIFSYQFTYKKGGMLLHMLRSEINNDSLFFSIYKNFLNRYAYSTASADDFRKVAEEVTGLSFEKYFNQWYYGSGYPTVTVVTTIKYDSLFVVVHNPTQASDNTCFWFQLVMKGNLINNTDTTFRIMVNDTVINFKTKLSANIESVDLNPNSNVIGFFKIVPFYLQSQDEIVAYPNPFTDTTTIDFSDINSLYEVKLFDMKGNLIKEYTNVRKKLKIEPGLLKPGTYVVQAKTETKTLSLKIVKN